MGRLDDIVERNRNPKRTERLTVGIGIALFLLLIIFLMTFTDLGLPKEDPKPPPASTEKRVNDIKLKVMDDSETPVAMLVKSGALDLSKPGNILKFIPKKPPMIIEAHEDRITLDLLKMPQLANNKRLRRVLNVITPLIGVRAIETDRTHLYVALRATPANLSLALAAIRNA